MLRGKKLSRFTFGTGDYFELVVIIPFLKAENPRDGKTLSL